MNDITLHSWGDGSMQVNGSKKDLQVKNKLINNALELVDM
jgi:hypothetical protein